jgi:hypothetical protein
VIAIQKAEKQRKTDGEHDVFLLAEIHVSVSPPPLGTLLVAHPNGTRR